MLRIIYTSLDPTIGEDLFLDGAVELDMLKKKFDSKEKAFAYIKRYEVNRLKKYFAEEGGVSTDKITAVYSNDDDQAYIDLSVDLGMPVGVAPLCYYIYRIVKE